MKNNKSLYELEYKINAMLKSMRPEQRPELSHRHKVVSIAYQAREAYQATDGNGNVESVTFAQVQSWLASDIR